MNATMTRRAAAVLAAVALAAPAAQASDAPAPETLLDYASLCQPVPANMAQDRLDEVVCVYTFGGEAVAVTAREVLEDATSIDLRQNADGTIAAPSADEILTYVRNVIMNDLVRQNGIEVGEAEVDEYATQTFGTADVATIAAYYGIDEQKAWRVLSEGAAVAKLRTQVCGGQIVSSPLAPDYPEDGDTTKANGEYAAYIVGLAGSDWDAEAGRWVEGSPFAYSLEPYDFNGEFANYEMAMTAYYTAYEMYSVQANDSYGVWADYVNCYLSQATITILTLKS